MYRFENGDTFAVALELFLQNFLETEESGEGRPKYMLQLVRYIWQIWNFVCSWL